VSPDTRPFQLSTFNGAKDNSPKRLDTTWGVASGQLTTFKKRGLKDGPSWSPALYLKGLTRKNENVDAVTAFVADIDDGTPPSELMGLWEGLAWCLHSSYSSTQSKPKWRVVFPLAEAVSREDWPLVWRKLAHHLTHGHADPSAKDPARLYYLPACPPDHFEYAFADQGEGQFLDPDLFVDPPAHEEAQKLVEAMKARPLLGTSGGEGKPGQDFNEKATPSEVLALLQRHGWQEHSQKGGAIYVTRPGKATRDGFSGVIGWPGDPSPVFYCFTSSAAPLEPSRAYAPFGLLGLLDHGSDWKAAGRALGELGYGEPLAPRVELDVEDLGVKAEGKSLRKEDNWHFTDAGNAERLIACHGQDLRHVPGLGWRIWDGKRWSADESHLMRLSRETVRASLLMAAKMLAISAKCDDKVERERLAKRSAELSGWALKSEATSRLQALISQASSFTEVKGTVDDFTAKPYVVAFQNGVWDRGLWREHRREDYIETLLPVAYYPDADRSEWNRLLERMVGGDMDLAKTLQDVAGYALSGASSLRVLPWLYGPRGSGKSSFSELLLTILGHAGKTLDWSLVSGQREAERLGAAVRGLRAIVLPEAGKKRLSAEILKSLSGSDRMPCRNLYENVTFSVTPTWCLMAVSNDPPSTNAHDDALKDRVMALPFVHSLDDGDELVFTGGTRIEEVRRNPESPLARGFLAWAVEGMANVLKTQEIYRAPIVWEHTRRFWADTDPLTPFWEGLEERVLEAGMTSSALHGAYVAWCDAQGVRKPLQGRAWAAACRAQGLEEWRTKTERGWKKYPDEGLFALKSRSEIGDGMTDLEAFSESTPISTHTRGVSEKRQKSVIPSPEREKRQKELLANFARAVAAEEVQKVNPGQAVAWSALVTEAEPLKAQYGQDWATIEAGAPIYKKLLDLANWWVGVKATGGGN
jgi:P4 family phage/plasmid primase-like protien